MNRAYFRVQAVVVFALLALVSWPQFQPARAAATMWRVDGPLIPRADASVAGRGRAGESEQVSAQIGYGSHGSLRDRADGGRGTSFGDTSSVNPASARQAGEMLANIARIAGQANAIAGSARTTSNAPVAYARILLRNALTGQVEAHAVADANGAFAFFNIRAAAYIIEVVGANGTVISSTPAVATATPDTTQKPAAVRVASGSTVAAVFGNVVLPTAAETIRTASDASVTKVTEPDTSLSPRN